MQKSVETFNNNTLESVWTNVTDKNSSKKVKDLKKYIQTLSKAQVIQGKRNHNLHIRFLAMEGYLALLSSKTLHLSLVEKRNILQTSFEKLRQYAPRKECFYILLRLQNRLCYYLIQLDQMSLARYILESMEDIYDQISKTYSGKFLDPEDLFRAVPLTSIRHVNPEKIDKVITNNIKIQAFLYKKLNWHHKYTFYYHIALQRQLEIKETSPQVWALRTARLGNYFLYLNQIGNARHHLCAAYYMLKHCPSNCKVMPDKFVPQTAGCRINYQLCHYWVKYGLALFKVSTKNILSKNSVHSSNETLDKSSNVKKAKDVCAEKTEKGDYKPEDLLTFTSLDLKAMEEKVPIENIKNVQEAWKLFSFTYKWLMRAKHRFNFKYHSAQYKTYTLQLAELFDHLVFFEKLTTSTECKEDCVNNLKK